ncbi:hypothetical protein GC194_04905 [bacterium]|nr:hypothetical protein [bacterium]
MVQEAESNFGAFQYVPESISRAKFNEAIGDFKKLTDRYSEKGVFLVKEEFPFAEFLFCSVQLTMPIIVYRIRFGFENYDIEPISVSFRQPVSGEPLLFSQVAFGIHLKIPEVNLDELLRQQGINVDSIKMGQLPALMIQGPGIIQGVKGNEPPFLCLQGVREYHNFPAHSGDSWFVHRGKGIGTLGYLLEKISSNGSELVANIGFKLEYQQIIRP